MASYQYVVIFGSSCNCDPNHFSNKYSLVLFICQSTCCIHSCIVWIVFRKAKPE